MLELTICTMVGVCIEITRRDVPVLACLEYGQVEMAKIVLNEHPGFVVKKYKCKA